MILSPRLQADRIMDWTALVVPPTIRKAWLAPKASAASCSASRITDTGWHRLSRGFMLFTSTPTHFSPRNSVSSGLPRPPFVAGYVKGHHPHFPELFQSFVDGRPILFQPILLFQAFSLPSSFFTSVQKNASCPLAACVLRSHPVFRFASIRGSPLRTTLIDRFTSLRTDALRL